MHLRHNQRRQQQVREHLKPPKRRGSYGRGATSACSRRNYRTLVDPNT